MTLLEIVLLVIVGILGVAAFAMFMMLKVFAKGASDIGSGVVKAFWR